MARSRSETLRCTWPIRVPAGIGPSVITNVPSRGLRWTLCTTRTLNPLTDKLPGARNVEAQRPLPCDPEGHVPCADDGSIQYGAPFFHPWPRNMAIHTWYHTGSTHSKIFPARYTLVS